MHPWKPAFALLVITTIISNATVAEPVKCPYGTSQPAKLKYIGYRESDGYVTFAVKNDAGLLTASTEYWLSNYQMDKAWAKAAYAGGIAATLNNSTVVIRCDGTSASGFYVFNN